MSGTLVKCGGGLADALECVHKLPRQIVFTWTAIISRLARSGQSQKALQMYDQMQEEGVEPNAYTFVSLLKACGSLTNLGEGRRIHREAIRHRCTSDLFVNNCLLDMYGKCMSIVDAEKVFNEMSNRDVVSWTTMITAYDQHGRPNKALQLYEQMREQGVSPNDRTFVSALQACSMLADKRQLFHSGQCRAVKYLQQGKALHADSWKQGYDTDVFVGNTLIRFYGKCGSAADARIVFDGLSRRDVVSWNVMLQTYVEQREAGKALQLYEAMQEDVSSTNVWSFVTTLQACLMLAEKENRVMIDGQSTAAVSLGIVRAIHVDAQRKHVDSHVCAANTLLNAYGKCGSILDAQILFDNMYKQDLVSWNVMLAAFVEHSQEGKVLELYQQMHEKGESPDLRSLMSVMQACGMLAEKGQDTVFLDGSSIKAESLTKGRSVHAYAWKKCFDSDVYLGSTVVAMYGKCGSIEDARIVFDGLPVKNVVSWNVMLLTSVEHGKLETTLELYRQMWVADVSPDARTMVTMLHTCGMLAEKEGYASEGQVTKVKALVMGKALHAHAERQGFSVDVFVGNTLLSMYGKCGSIADAQIAFNGLSDRNPVSWSAMLAAYVEEGLAEKALQLYTQMTKEGVSPGVRSVVIALQACSILAENLDARVYGQDCKAILRLGKDIHDDAQCHGFDTDVFVGSALVNMYGKCGSLADARNAFYKLPNRNVVAWNALLTAHNQQGEARQTLELYEEMKVEAVSSDALTFVSALQACGILAEKEREFNLEGRIIKLESLGKGKTIHGEVWLEGCCANLCVARALVSMYGKCRSIMDVVNVFDGFVQPDVSMWTAFLGAHVDQSLADRVLQLYEQMQEEGVSSNSKTFLSLIQGLRMLAEKEEGVAVNGVCIKPRSLQSVRAVHAHAADKGCDSDGFVGSMLVDTYGKCGSVADAQVVFDRAPELNTVLWNAILSAYVEQGHAQAALLLYEQMVEEGVTSDSWTFSSAVHACSLLAEREEEVLMDGVSTKVRSLQNVRTLHASALRKYGSVDVYVGSALITVYGKCGRLVDACVLFDEMRHRDLVVWTALLSAYVDQGCGEKGLNLYRQMQLKGVSPDIRTIVSAIHACGMVADEEVGVVSDGVEIKLKSLKMGRSIHSDAKKKGYYSDLYISNTLIAMYGKCGSITEAQRVFAGLGQRNVVSWNAMLAAYVKQGDVETALQFCREMQDANQSPDEITMVSIFQVCSNAGSLSSLRQVHSTLISNQHILSPFLASALITAYGRCAGMSDAQSVFNAVSHPDLVLWNALIAGYARQGDTAASLCSYEKMLLAGVKPDGVTFLSILSACSHAGLVDEGVQFFISMTNDRGLTPEIDHYVSMVDLFGRAGLFTTLKRFVSTMPLQPNLALWLSVLTACRKHGKVGLGKVAFTCAVRLQPKHPSAYVLMSNILADGGFWKLANEMRKVRQKGGAWKTPSRSWIEHDQELRSFMVGADDRCLEDLSVGHLSYEV